MTASFDYLPAILTLCLADSTLTTTFTGGIYLQRALPGGGMTRELLPAAYNTGARLKPILVIKGRAVIPSVLKDRSNQYRSTNQAIEFWSYQDRDATYATLRTGINRVYALFEQKPAAGAAKFAFMSELEWRDPAINNAITLMHEYTLTGSRKV